MSINLQGSRTFSKIRELNYKDLMIFAIPCLIFLFYLYVFNPGILSYVSFEHLHQVATSNYNNWHPFFYTFIVMLCLKVYPSPVSVALFQILTFSTMWMIICRYNRQDKSRNMDKQFTLQAIFTLVISLIPINAIYAITLWNDILFSYNLMFLCFLFKVLIDKPHVDLEFLVLISLIMAFTAQLRPNGMYVIIAVLIILAIYLYFKNKSQKLHILIPALTLVLILFIATLNTTYDVEDHQRDAVMDKIEHCLVYYDLNLDLNSQDRDKIHELISEEDIQNNFYKTYTEYIFGVSNGSAFKNNELTYISMLISYSIQNPIHFLKYLFDSSPLVWNIVRGEGWIGIQLYNADVSIVKEQFFNFTNEPASTTYENVSTKNLETPLYDFINSFVNFFQFDNEVLNTLFMNPAFCMYMSILCMVAISLMTKSRSIYFVYLPTFLNIIVIMFSIPAQDTRYLYANFLTFYLLVIILINEREKIKLKKKLIKSLNSPHKRDNYPPNQYHQRQKNIDELKQHLQNEETLAEIQQYLKGKKNQ